MTETPDKTLIDALLEEQQNLSAVARFAQKHEQHELPLQARYYRDLIPLTTPGPGQQYAFEVNLDQCSGCKACATACHALNGLDEDETFRSIGLLHGGTKSRPVLQTVTTACHHCVDPACLNGCPVLAYEKDPLTGIVRHLDDQCIGCQYCVLQCPYDVPKYNERKGIVRKCDMCSNRLAAREAPACVQACPNEAIRITLADTNAVRATWSSASENAFLPGAPDPRHTLPATRFLSQNDLLPRLQPANAHDLQPEKAHWSLILLLVFSQAAIGAVAVEVAGSQVLDLPLPFRRWLALGALGFALLSFAVSIFHLGRPLGAWRVFLGLRHSWMSREIVCFGLFGKALALYTASLWMAAMPLSQDMQLFRLLAAPSVQTALGVAALLSGAAGLFCSAMIYHDTRREFWRLGRTALRFGGSAVILGTLGAALTGMLLPGSASQAEPFLLLLCAAAVASKLLIERLSAARWKKGNRPALQRSAALLERPLREMAIHRAASAAAGGILAPLALAGLGGVGGPLISALALGAFGLVLTSEIMERCLFFTAVSPPRMPGGVAS